MTRPAPIRRSPAERRRTRSGGVFAKKFHTVVRKARADGTIDIRVSEKRLFVGTLYAVLSVAGKFAEGLVYPSEDHHNMLEELQMIKQMILGALKKGTMGTVETMGTMGTMETIGTMGTVGTMGTAGRQCPHCRQSPQSPQCPQCPQSPQKGGAC